MSFTTFCSTSKIQLLPLTHSPSPSICPINPTFQTSLPNSNRNSLNKSPPLTQKRHTNNTVDQTISWTSSIAHYCRQGMLSEAAAEFSRMRLAEIQPNDITFVTLLSACAHFPSKSLQLGVMIHGYVSKLGFGRDNVMLWTALVDMYSKCAHVDSARKVFDEMSIKNSMSWNTMIDGYTRNGDFKSAVILFEEMPVRDKISWTALINGFVRKGFFEDALECFRDMQLSGVEPDYVTIVAVLSACANLGMLGLGLWFHYYAMQRGFCENIKVKNSLIDMYSRCGFIDFAHQEFRNMDRRSLVSWNSMIAGLAINGHAEPDGVGFTGALTACSHAGLVDKGLELYDRMTKVHKISPRIEHYGCLVDLLSRAGYLEDAFDVIKSMPMKPNDVVLGSLLAACRTHGDFGLAERLIHYLVGSKPGSDSNYVSLSNIYAAEGRWDGVGKVRRIMKARGITKTSGFSTIEMDCRIHEFMAGDKSHHCSKDIYTILDQLSVQAMLYEYVPEDAEDLSE